MKISDKMFWKVTSHFKSRKKKETPETHRNCLRFVYPLCLYFFSVCSTIKWVSLQFEN